MMSFLCGMFSPQHKIAQSLSFDGHCLVAFAAVCANIISYF
jgi:hypothetical protein